MSTSCGGCCSGLRGRISMKDPRSSRSDLGTSWPFWGRVGDAGVVAVDPATGPVGAAWLRLLTGSQSLSPSFVAADVPELAIAVEDGHEGRGVGSRLLEGLLAGHGNRTIVLTARTTNPAIRLYERFGLEVVEIITNRVGTRSVKMIRPGDRVSPLTCRAQPGRGSLGAPHDPSSERAPNSADARSPLAAQAG